MSTDIVHCDPPQPVTSPSPSSTVFSKPSLPHRSTLEPNAIPPTDSILEIKASTRAYPNWWKSETDRDQAKKRPSLSRRESVNEVLERNICFVDTPGYGSSDDVPAFQPWSDGSLMTYLREYQVTLRRIMKESMVFCIPRHGKPIFFPSFQMVSAA